MTQSLNFLTDDDIRQIKLLIEALEHSTFDFLRLELADLKLTLGRGAVPPSELGAAAMALTAPTTPPPSAAAAAAPTADPLTATSQITRSERSTDDGTVAVVAPMLGKFYANPAPGAGPFVSMGTAVDKDTTVALIEVMKVFTAVRAGVTGIVTEICVEDGQFIEFGQVLFRVQPSQVPVDQISTATTSTQEGSGT